MITPSPVLSNLLNALVMISFLELFMGGCNNIKSHVWPLRKWVQEFAYTLFMEKRVFMYSIIEFTIQSGYMAITLIIITSGSIKLQPLACSSMLLVHSKHGWSHQTVSYYD